ncbi:MAG: MlaD family protein [Proteobacteria bacterium]|nr:MlaD family protein [Pseudomonadota bacterium]
MTPKAKHVLIGLFVVTLSMTLVFFVVWLGGRQINQETDVYLVYLTESVSGLPDNATVKYKGVTIGLVENIRIDPHNSDQVELRLQIDKGSPIKEDSKAILTSRGITGIQYIEITGGKQNTPILSAKDGQKYPVIATQKSTLSTAQESLGPILQNINLTILDIRNLLQGSEHINHILGDIRIITRAIAQQPETIPNLFREVQILSSELNGVASQIQELVNTSNQFLANREGKVDNLLVESRKLISNLNQISKAINEKQLVAGLGQTLESTDKLMTNIDSQLTETNFADIMTEMETTLHDIQDLANNLNKVAGDLRTRASPLILSRPDQGVQPK